MRTSLRASIAALASIAVLAVSAVAAGSTAASGPVARVDGIHEGSYEGESGTGEGASVSGLCAEGHPDCVDTVDPGQSAPGYGGGGYAGGPVTGPPAGSGGDPGTSEPCGVEVVDGTGPDGTVSYRMCPDDPGLEPEPVPVPNVVEPTPGMVGLHPVSFAGGSAYVSPDDPTVVIVDYWSGIEPCYVLDHVEVRETDDTVTITLFEGSDPAADAVACIEIGVFKRVYVTLDSPLGDRQIVDGAAV